MRGPSLTDAFLLDVLSCRSLQAARGDWAHTASSLLPVMQHLRPSRQRAPSTYDDPTLSPVSYGLLSVLLPVFALASCERACVVLGVRDAAISEQSFTLQLCEPGHTFFHMTAPVCCCFLTRFGRCWIACS